MRIAVAGFMHESNTFNKLKADRAAFTAQCLRFGPDCARDWRDAHHEVGGFMEALDAAGAETWPIVMAWATPSGPVADAVFDEVSGALVASLRKVKCDGLLLALHGAMVTESHLDGDGEFLARIRQAVGPQYPIVATFDLHGNLSKKQIDSCTAAVAYRTCPHVDQRECGRRAASLLLRTIREEIRPTTALAKPPLILNIMAHETAKEPLKSFMDKARALESQPGVLAASLLPGFAYADVPQMGPSVAIVTNNDAALAQRLAKQLGDDLWKAREMFTPRLPDAKAAVETALQATKLPVVLVDTGDNVGGGSAGDGTIVLRELLRQGATDAVVCLYAPEEVKLCQSAGIGKEVDLNVGGKVDRLHGDPMAVRGKVRVLHDGVYVEAAARHGGKRFNDMGITALVEIVGRNLLVLTSQRHPPFSLGQLTCLGIAPERQKILVVKAAIAYKAAYGPIAGTIIEIDTPGLTAVNPARFDYRHVTRPLYPLD